MYLSEVLNVFILVLINRRWITKFFHNWFIQRYTYDTLFAFTISLIWSALYTGMYVWMYVVCERLLVSSRLRTSNIESKLYRDVPARRSHQKGIQYDRYCIHACMYMEYTVPRDGWIILPAKLFWRSSCQLILWLTRIQHVRKGIILLYVG